jgi:hypothetical protein
MLTGLGSAGSCFHCRLDGLGCPVTRLSLGYTNGPAFVVRRPRSQWTCWTSTRDTQHEDFEYDCDIHTRSDAAKCGTGGSVEGGVLNFQRFLNAAHMIVVHDDDPDTPVPEFGCGRPHL